MNDMPSDADNRAYYDDFSSGYERERGRGYHQLLDDLELSIVAPLARGRRVLEIGCGTGLILRRIAREAAHARGVDLSPGMLQVARERGLDVSLASATQLPFADASFDLVCSFKCWLTSVKSKRRWPKPHASRVLAASCCSSSTIRGACAISRSGSRGRKRLAKVAPKLTYSRVGIRQTI